MNVDREEVTKEDNFDIDNNIEEEEEEEWNNGQDWTVENDEQEEFKEESNAYLDFLNDEVCSCSTVKLFTHL
jgi:hypothetical protein